MKEFVGFPLYNEQKQNVVQLILKKDASTFKLVEEYDLNDKEHNDKLEEDIIEYQRIRHEPEDVDTVEVSGPHGSFLSHMFLWHGDDHIVVAMDLTLKQED